jgi:2-oxoglutarate ferredoxin oxidoreductase subunit gamma
MKLRFAGFGGQGVVLCGVIFGKAAVLDGKRAVQTQAYGSASRGGLTKSDVCIETSEIYDLTFESFDALVLMSQEAYDHYAGNLADGGQLFYESDMVEIADGLKDRAHGMAATDLAFKDFGRKIMANMILMGYLNETMGIVSHESLVKTVREVVPKGTEDKNQEVVERGMQMAARRRDGDETTGA